MSLFVFKETKSKQDNHIQEYLFLLRKKKYELLITISLNVEKLLLVQKPVLQHQHMFNYKRYSLIYMEAFR